MIATNNKLGFTRYKGTIIERTATGEYIALKKKVATRKEAEEVINNAFKTSFNIFDNLKTKLK